MQMSLNAADKSVEVLETPELPSNGDTSEGGLGELRKILVQSDSVSEVLPSALRKSAKRDNRLTEATLPIVEENIKLSAKRNPKILADAIFPIIGPAIRKAIAEALGQMVQSLNQTLEHSFSPKGMKWRLEAMRTGKPFGEIVMLNTLLYRVEQVFLIHKDTGILLRHVSIDPTVTEDGDMVSAMLTAIQDFVHDSFQSSEDATLDALKVRDLSVWIEYGPNAILAAVIRGNAPLTVRETLLEAIELVQFDFDAEFRDFKGDAAAFERARPILERCLRFQLGAAETEKKGILTPFNALAGIALLIALVVGFFWIRDYWRWSGFVSRLKSEPGFVVAESERGFFTHSISGLRDELASDPETIRAEFKLDADDVEQIWKPFQDVSPGFILDRAQRLLAPPPGVTLTYENGILFADGVAPRDWFVESRRIAPAMIGVKSLQVGFDSLKRSIESEKIRFGCGTVNFVDRDAQIVGSLTADFEDLCRVSKASGRGFRVEIQGVADSTGTDEINAGISQARADKILAELFSRSELLKSTGSSFKAVGTGASGDTGECGVRFRVFLEEK
jgi:OOP family OmpA-OmpF porin